MSGEIISCNKIYKEWKVCNFSKSCVPTLKSPPVHFSNKVWYLKIKFYATVNRPCFRMSLCTQDKVENVTVTFTIGIKCSNPAIKWGPETQTFRGTQEWEFSEYYYLDLLSTHLRNYKHGNALTFYFEATNQTTVKDAGSQCSPLYSTTSLSHDLQSLLLNGKDSDVTIEVQDKMFKVHEVILKARSPVFTAMFENNMKEKTVGTVKIEDCDPEIFENFIQFLYSGEVEKILPDNASSLYRIADKYGLEELKERCADKMEQVLSLDSVYDVLFLADMYNDIRLKKSAEEYLVVNMKTALSTNKWNQFMTENSVLAAKILMRAFQEFSSKMEKI